MKRLDIFCVILTIIFTFTGCKVRTNSKPEDYLSLENAYLSDQLTKAGLEDVTFVEQITGNCISTDVNNSNSSLVYLLSDYEKYDDDVYHQSYLAIVIDDKVLLKDLENGSYGDSIYVCDIDGDEIDEIIVQQTIGMSGGAGQYLSRIFKVVDEKITETFSSSNSDQFDTGFFNNMKENFIMEIGNCFTGDLWSLDFTDNDIYASIYFDDNGAVKCTESIWCDSFRKFNPKDIDGDGVFEICCLQYVSFGSHSNYIGDAKSYIKYNLQTNEFEVVDAEFILAESIMDSVTVF